MDPLPLLKDLVAIPSVNPMGRDVTGPEYLETRVTEYLVDVLTKACVAWERVETAPGRANVLARLDAESTDAPTLLLDAHQDTVPTDGMVIPPFDPVERDGKLFGRGTCDVKGGMAAMLAAFLRLCKERPAGRPHVVLSLTCDEEATSLGINHLVDSWLGRKPAYKLCPQKPTAAIVAEPTLLDIVVAHRGAYRWKLRTEGVACHSSRPMDGVNAIYRMGKLLGVLEEFAAWLPGSRPAHRLCGPATLSVGLISGGSSVNVVPDGCAIDIDRRVLPGEDRTVLIEEVAKFLKERTDVPFTNDPPFVNSPPLPDELNGDLADALMKSIMPVVGPKAKIGVPYGTHASRVALAQVPAVVFGPGDIAQAHTKDEWIEIDQLRQGAEVYYQFCADGAERLR